MPAPTRADRLIDLVEAALALPPPERPGLLEAECADDPGLRAEVESLLRFEEPARGFIAQPAMEAHGPRLLDGADEPATRAMLQPDEMLGECRVVSLLGEGGMGEVYLAQDLALQRPVAIKLIKRGMASDTLLGNFRQEKLILAGLNHPNIARLYGGALNADGLPYLVMEYVEGERLDRYCEANALAIPERLALFRKVCSAVTYAHQNLIIHRDLKPANIRVTSEGEPKLLDFGIARLLDAQAAPGAEQTVTLLGAMTPGYASPEQLRFEPMTTASDIYSLGVVLYELLSGARPAPAASRVTGEFTAERPSAAVRRTTPKLARQLAGDLDNIVLTAMRPEPARRYASASQLSEDIRRHLDGQPITARKETWRYVGAKFFMRNKALAAAMTLALLALLGGMVATNGQRRRAEAERQRAERRFEDVRRLADSLIFEIHDSVQNLPGSTPTRRLIVARALQYLDGLTHDGAGGSALQQDLANAYEKIGDAQGNPYFANLGDKDGAESSYLKAQGIREALVRTQPSVENRIGLGRVYRALGDIQLAKGSAAGMLGRYRQSLEGFAALAREHPDDPAVLAETATAYEALGDGLAPNGGSAQEVLRNYTRSLAMRQQLHERDPGNARYRRSLGLEYMKVGSASMPDKATAVKNIQHAIELIETLSRENPNDARALREVGFAYYTLGRVLVEAGDFPGALASRTRQLAIRERVAAGDPKNSQAQFDLATAHADVAEAMAGVGDIPHALENARTALGIFETLLASDGTNAIYRRNLGLSCERLAQVTGLGAAEPGLAAAERAARWNEAAGWYEKARGHFLDQSARGALQPADTGKPEALAAEVARAREAAGAK